MKGRYVWLMIVLLVSVVSLLTAGQFGEGLKGGIWQATTNWCAKGCNRTKS
jgi:hypothetical protein